MELDFVKFWYKIETYKVGVDFVHRIARRRLKSDIIRSFRILQNFRSGTSGAPVNQLAERLLGNTIYANVLILGFAWQKGLLPISLEALMRAVELNGVAVEKNSSYPSSFLLNYHQVLGVKFSSF